MARGQNDPTLGLARILKQKDKTAKAKARWRIMVASDPSRPVRTFTLPRLAPTLVTLSALTLVAATVVLAFGSWKLSGSLGALQRRVRAMVQAADSVALAGSDKGGGRGNDAMLAATTARVVQTMGARTGKFTIQAANNGEEVEVVLNLDTGEVDAAGYTRLRHMMRCLRTTAETPIDPRLIDLLYRISQRTKQKIILVSGFRAPMFSLATLSYHTRGMAADIRIPGMTPLMARDLAESMGVHGLGYYPVSGFIHVDVRDDKQRWTDYSSKGGDNEGTEHGPSHGEDVKSGDDVQSGEIAPGAGGPG